ncbi:MAG: response regulator [Candidatus Eutrophobiaceae bacterium]
MGGNRHSSLRTSILLVEDDAAILKMLANFLDSKGYDCHLACNIATAKQLLNQCSQKLIILDWMLPDGSGEWILRYIKSLPEAQRIPVIVLTARIDETNKLNAFELGCDDYIDKPFSLSILEKRIDALLRRSYPQEKQFYRLGSLVVNRMGQCLMLRDEKIDAGRIEFNLLLSFVENPNQVLERKWLLERVWHGREDVSERVVDVYVLRLRKLLRRHLPDEWLETVWGSGYRYNPRCLNNAEI